MSQKFAVVSDKYQTVRRPAGAAIAKGEPVLVGTGPTQTLAFTFDAYTTTDEQVLVFAADKIRVTAQAANSQLASVDFAVMDFIYWDPAAEKITDISAGNLLCGRCLEAKNFTAGVNEGDSLAYLPILPL